MLSKLNYFRICLSGTHAWQGENGLPLASSAQAVALQFIRCVLHQLAPNGIFLQVFQTQMKSELASQFER